MRFIHYASFACLSLMCLFFIVLDDVSASSTFRDEINETVILPETSFNAFVSYVIDGDSLEIIYLSETYKVRLLGVDAPEKSQAYGNESTRLLRELVSNKKVTMQVFGRDRYNRWLARVKINHLDVNLTLVDKGAAWCYFFSQTRHLDFSLLCQSLEKKAKQLKIGLWKNDQRISPHRWRANQNTEDDIVQKVVDDTVKGFMTEMMNLFKMLIDWFQCLLS